MGNYENGTFTRQAIVSACKQLFYEKGFEESGYSDICEASHVNRSTIYYHFESKDAIYYDVLWEYLTDNKRTVEKYCPKSEYHYILAVYIIYYQVKFDEKARRFHYYSCKNTPVYTGKLDLSHFYHVLYEKMWESFQCKNNITPLAFASMYGYLACCMRMLCEHPEKYSPLEIYEHCCNSCFSVWGAPQEIIDQIWRDVKYYISLIPEEEMRVHLS